MTVTAKSGDPRFVLPGSRSPLDPDRALRVGGHGLPKEQVERVQRERLIDAFVQVCARDGYQAAGVRSACKAAGVAFNTFYDHFQSKEDLFLAAYDAGMKQLFQAARTAFAESEGMAWEQRVEHTFEVFLDLLIQNCAFAQFAIVEAVKAGPVAIAHVEQPVQYSFIVFAGAVPRKGLRLQTEQIIHFIVGGIYQSLYRMISSGQIERLKELKPQLSEFVFTMLEAAPPRRSEKPSSS